MSRYPPSPTLMDLVTRGAATRTPWLREVGGVLREAAGAARSLAEGMLSASFVRPIAGGCSQCLSDEASIASEPLKDAPLGTSLEGTFTLAPTRSLRLAPESPEPPWIPAIGPGVNLGLQSRPVAAGLARQCPVRPGRQGPDSAAVSFPYPHLAGCRLI